MRQKEKNDFRELIKNKEYIICITAIAFFTFFRMIVYSGRSSLWIDDLATIQYTWGESFIGAMYNAYKYDSTVAPLFYGFAAVWLKIIPYGTVWVRILPEIFVVLGIYSISFLASKMYTKKVGIIAAIITSTSSMLITFGGYTFRGYSMFFFLNVIVLYMFIKRREDTDLSFVSIVAFGLMQSILNYTHFFGGVICFALAIYELIEIIKGIIPRKYIISYFVMAITFIPYLVGAYINSMNLYSAFWPKVPEWNDIVSMFVTLLSNIEIYKYIFLCALVYLSISFINDANTRNFKFVKENIYSYLMLWIIVCVMGIIFIYSKYIRPSYSMWVDRYFICLLPPIFIILSTFINRIINFFNERMSKKACLALVSTLFISCIYTTDIAVKNFSISPFEQASTFFQQQEDIYNEDTVAYIPIYVGYKGWEYYSTKGYTIKNFNCMYAFDNFKDISKYNVVYAFEVCDGIGDANRAYLQQNYVGTLVEPKYGIWKYVKIQN